MENVADPTRVLWPRIAQFPLTRLILLGGILFLMMGVSNGFRLKLAVTPLASSAVTVAMTALCLAVYAGFVQFVERRPVSELALPDMRRELGIGLLVGAGLCTSDIAQGDGTSAIYPLRTKCRRRSRPCKHWRDCSIR